MPTERGLSPISGPRVIYADLPPDANNDIADSISVGDIWIDTATDTSYICVDNALAAAAWDSMGGDVTASSTTTLTNKSLVDSSTYIIDNSDATKKAQFECSGITTGTTRTYTFPNSSTTLVGTDTTSTLTNKSGNISQWTNDSNYLSKSSNNDPIGWSIESPTSTEDFGGIKIPFAVTITKISCVLVGSASPSVTWTIRQGTDRSAAGTEVVTGGTTTTNTTSGADITSFNDATCPADSILWLETTAKSGTVTSMHITIYFTRD